jgi:hypothetical protein
MGGTTRRADSNKNVIVVGSANDDAATLAAKSKIQDAITRYGDLRSSLRGAQVELDVAKAAFKYKYHVITPAEVPEHPKPPSTALAALLAVLAAVLMAFLSPTILDLCSGWLVNVWRRSKSDAPLTTVYDPPWRPIVHVTWPPPPPRPYRPALGPTPDMPRLPRRLTR